MREEAPCPFLAAMPSPPLPRLVLLLSLLLALPARAPAAGPWRHAPSALLGPGALELRIWGNLYTQTAYYDDSGARIDSQPRQTYATTTFTALWGWRPGIELGIAANLKAVRDATFPVGRTDRLALASIVPSVKLQPWAARERLALQVALFLPAARELGGGTESPFLDWGGPRLEVLLLYDRPMRESLWLYLEGGLHLRGGRGAEALLVPMQVALNWRLDPRWILYAPFELTPEFAGGGRSGYFSQLGLGSKLRLFPRIELELLLTTFPAGRSAGAGQTANLGLRMWRP